MIGLTRLPSGFACAVSIRRLETRQKFITGRLTWIFAIIAFLFFIPLAAVPFFIRPCKDVLHHCPNCNTLLSIRIRF
ncbi:unnamed protein product [Dracunculus medinensis]|uniref:LITAF domain-containing protein n=1 Tax=Dracunculus medinensis TaxID=318479 RepID=A0A0N4USC1_DRAME|nr:unnamed protein product [Dracunculus medinensis]